MTEPAAAPIEKITVRWNGQDEKTLRKMLRHFPRRFLQKDDPHGNGVLLPDALRPAVSVQIAEYASDDTENFYIPHENRTHGGIRRLQAYVIFFSVECFYSSFAFKAVYHSDDDLSVESGILLADENIISVEDSGLDHTFPFDSQHEMFSVSADVASRNRKGVGDIFFCEDRYARSHLPHQRDVYDIGPSGSGAGVRQSGF